MMPTADVATLRRYVGGTTGSDDDLLADRLDVARAWVEARVKASSVGHDEVEEAILLLANRLYKRRQSPEGTAGFGGEGVVVRIMSRDPDIALLLERHADMSDELTTGAGIG